jgi:hypothetical protein
LNHSRFALSLGVLAVSLALAFLLRQAVYDLVVVPVAYVVWLLSAAYAAVPQQLTWSALVLLTSIAILMQLIPEPGLSAVAERHGDRPKGPVESLAIWILRARKSNYFKWQLANRLGRIARRLHDPGVRPEREAARAAAVAAYLTAGIDQSFVDFPGPRHRLQRHRATPLDLDPVRVVDNLESELEIGSGSNAESR